MPSGSNGRSGVTLPSCRISGSGCMILCHSRMLRAGYKDMTGRRSKEVERDKDY